MWNRVLALVVKEFISLLKDKKSRLILIVPPVIQLVIFGYATSYDLNNVPYAIYDNDQGQVAQEFLNYFEGSPNFRLLGHVRQDHEMARQINDKEALLVIHLAPDFSRKILRGETADVQIIIDGRNSNTAQIALNYVRDIVNEFNRGRHRTEHATAPATRLVTRAWYNRNLESRWFFIPGVVGTLTQVIAIVITSLSVAREREHGTFDQLLVTPLRPLEILLGKAIPAFVIGLFEASLIIAMAILWFDIPLRGSVVTLYAGTSVFLLASIGIGLMISSLSVTLQQAQLGTFLFLVPAVMLSGFATPIANMPAWLQELTRLNPLRYFISILRSTFLEATPFKVLIPEFWPLLVIALLNLSLAAWLFRKRMN